MALTTNYEPKKIIWLIGEVAAFFNLSTSAIRYYDDEFKITEERKRHYRIFREKQLDKLLTILALREEGYSIWGIHKKLGI